MGGQVSRTDFEWVYTDEPHASRRKAIMAKYPQIKELFGPDSNMVYKVGFMITLQLIACYFVQDAPWPVIVLLAYCFGGVINHAMGLAIHEISHNLAFGHSRPLHNRILGIVGNVILVLPFSIMYKRYHLEHHKYQSLAYLVIGNVLVLGAHPVAGHFISDHYMFKKGYETYSYYGPLNAVTFNVGYHNEHHDFPNIPGCRLPKVREIAPEFYVNLPHHTSWSRVMYDFVTDPDIGPFARVKRRTKPIPIHPTELDVDGDPKAE
ncbi:DEGS1 [Branchiostoma lanceolatum]|uniref:DEGS1 protein n=1 Tax=Branchiostoma lanceolatum TaxID=7740 RepID=A0A8K0EM05_BRALA|nr:DEGS1 [Branchiostoma lanceolatum]